jgi:putative membrane-bound dehydrogenase-like protein
VLIGSGAIGQAADFEAPRVADPRLEITLFAGEPQIVTPTGIAVDEKGRVLVIESHTHFRPKDYDGPSADRIRSFEDADADGKPDRIETFFSGTRSTMNLAVAPDASVYVATRSEVFRLRDADGDGRADIREPIVRLETSGDYPHNGLSGFAFDFAGDVYFGFGENLGAEYKLIGTDGTTLSGGGEGGNIYRCKADGSALRREATGFWNPFHLCFDAFGRLLAVDNDPDSRPPCRLLHIVDGGDYGYRYRNGRKGLHPFTAWNGELPGTLPMVAGTGEAPSGILAYESTNLPAEYRGTLLVTSWGDHRIDRFRLEEHGATFRSLAEPIVIGGEWFRPVGIAVAPDGSVFISDWVDKSYELHRKGRIWKLRSKRPPAASAAAADREHYHPDRNRRERAARALTRAGRAGITALEDAASCAADPRVRATALAALAAAEAVGEEFMIRAQRDPAPAIRALAVRLLPYSTDDMQRVARRDGSPLVRAEALRQLRSPEATPLLVNALTTDDPFIEHSARFSLGKTARPDDLRNLARSDRVERRLAAVLVFRACGDQAGVDFIPQFLRDADPRVQFCAVEWVGEERLAQFRPLLHQLLSDNELPQLIFEAVLAALERLDGAQRAPGEEIAGEEYVARWLRAPNHSAAVYRRALRMLRPDYPDLTLVVLERFTNSDEPELRLEAVRTLRDAPHAQRFDILAGLARSDSLADDLRAEATMGLPASSAAGREMLISLATNAPPVVREEALRALRRAELTQPERDRLKRLLGAEARVAELAAGVLGLETPRPANDELDAWIRLLEGPADAKAGERVFYHPNGPGCYRCHQVNGRGGKTGPDLSRISSGLDRRRLIESIVQPSKEIAPAFVPWLIEKRDGAVLTGLFLGETLTGQHIYADSQGQRFLLAVTEIAERRPAKVSIMPDELARTLVPGEFRDLLAYLATLR